MSSGYRIKQEEKVAPLRALLAAAERRCSNPAISCGISKVGGCALGLIIMVMECAWLAMIIEAQFGVSLCLSEFFQRATRLRYNLKKREGASSKVEKEKKHYQGLPEDFTPIAGKVGASAAEM